MLAGLLAGGMGLAGGLVGAFAQEEANEMNWQINLMNYYARERERRDRIRETQEIRRDQKLGATDANGNRTKFVEGQGWVSELGPQDKLINALQRQEQQKVLTEDLPARRRQQQQNTEAQQEERWTADNLLDRFGREAYTDPEAVRRTMVGAATGAINREYDEILNQAMRKNVRTGASNTGQVIADLARDRMKTIAASIAGIPMQAEQAAQQQTQQRQGATANLYNMFAQRAGQIPGVAYQPQNVQGNANNLMNTFANMSQQGNSLVASAMAQQGGTLDYVKPNTGFGDAIAAGGSALGASLDRQNAYDERQRSLARAQQF